MREPHLEVKVMRRRWLVQASPSVTNDIPVAAGRIPESAARWWALAGAISSAPASARRDRRSERASSSLHLAREPVASAPDGGNQGRVLGVALDLAPQSTHLGCRPRGRRAPRSGRGSGSSSWSRESTIPGRSSSTTSSRNSPEDSGVTTPASSTSSRFPASSDQRSKRYAPDGSGSRSGGRLCARRITALMAGEQLARVERLGNVVVRPDLQAHDAVRLLAHGGQQDDRDAGRLAQVPAEREAVLARHHDVEHHEVDRRRAQRPARGGRAFRHGHAHLVAFEVPRQRLANLAVVVDHQHMRGCVHGRELTRLRARCAKSLYQRVSGRRRATARDTFAPFAVKVLRHPAPIVRTPIDTRWTNRHRR